MTPPAALTQSLTQLNPAALSAANSSARGSQNTALSTHSLGLFCCGAQRNALQSPEVVESKSGWKPETEKTML